MLRRPVRAGWREGMPAVDPVPGAEPRVDADPATKPEAAPAQRSGRLANANARVARLRQRAEGTTAGEIQRRASELRLSQQAAILSALAMVLLIPALISVQAALPIGDPNGLASGIGRHLSLSEQAMADVRALLPGRHRVQNPTTSVGALFTVISAYAWPAQLQRTYHELWGLPMPGFRSLWRPLIWTPSLFGVVAAVAVTGRVFSGAAGGLLTAVVGVPLVLGWTWWTQHLLLGGLVPWRALLPAAICTAVALVGLSLGSSFYLSRSVIYNFDRYGPIGVVFVLMSWLTMFSLLMLGGALAGHTIWRHRSASGGYRSSPGG